MRESLRSEAPEPELELKRRLRAPSRQVSSGEGGPGGRGSRKGGGIAPSSGSAGRGRRLLSGGPAPPGVGPDPARPVAAEGPPWPQGAARPPSVSGVAAAARNSAGAGRGAPAFSWNSGRERRGRRRGRGRGGGPGRRAYGRKRGVRARPARGAARRARGRGLRPDGAAGPAFDEVAVVLGGARPPICRGDRPPPPFLPDAGPATCWSVEMLRASRPGACFLSDCAALLTSEAFWGFLRAACGCELYGVTRSGLSSNRGSPENNFAR